MDKFIDRSGWPPKVVKNDIPFDSWQKLFRGKSLTFWKDKKWEVRTISRNSYIFEHQEWNLLTDIIGANTLDLDNSVRRQIYNTRERFDRIRSYVEINLGLPQPPILLQVGEDKYQIMDGHHRLVVLFFLSANSEKRRALPVTYQAWVAF